MSILQTAAVATTIANYFLIACPVCRTKFNLVTVKRGIDGPVLRTYEVENKTPSSVPYPELYDNALFEEFLPGHSSYDHLFENIPFLDDPGSELYDAYRDILSQRGRFLEDTGRRVSYRIRQLSWIQETLGYRQSGFQRDNDSELYDDVDNEDIDNIILEYNLAEPRRSRVSNLRPRHPRRTRRQPQTRHASTRTSLPTSLLGSSLTRPPPPTQSQLQSHAQPARRERPAMSRDELEAWTLLDQYDANNQDYTQQGNEQVQTAASASTSMSTPFSLSGNPLDTGLTSQRSSSDESPIPISTATATSISTTAPTSGQMQLSTGILQASSSSPALASASSSTSPLASSLTSVSSHPLPSTSSTTVESIKKFKRPSRRSQNPQVSIPSQPERPSSSESASSSSSSTLSSLTSLPTSLSDTSTVQQLLSSIRRNTNGSMSGSVSPHGLSNTVVSSGPSRMQAYSVSPASSPPRSSSPELTQASNKNTPPVDISLNSRNTENSHPLQNESGTAGQLPSPPSETPNISSSPSDIQIKEKIQKLVRDALRPLYRDGQITKEEYTSINQRVSRVMYRHAFKENQNNKSKKVSARYVQKQWDHWKTLVIHYVNKECLKNGIAFQAKHQ